MITKILFRIMLLLQKRYDNYDPNLIAYPSYIITLSWAISRRDQDIVLKQHTITLSYIKNQVLQYVNFRKILNNFNESLIKTIDSVEDF